MIEIKMKPQTKKPKRRINWLPIIVIILVVALLSYLAPLPKLRGQTNYSYKSRPETVSLAWPGYGQSAVGAVGYGLLDSHGNQSPVPMASITKTITALAVLKKRPLMPGDQGPTIKISASDVAAFNNYYSQGGSVVSVSEGEQISEYQALQAMLLPSANNMADTLARWAFGSLDSYVSYANSYLKSQGLDGTTVADASGFSSKSVSTSADLTNLGLILINNPVLRDIVSQPAADVPVAGNVHNTNWLLGDDGIVGIKTGNTEQAGGCYLFAAHRLIDNQTLTIVGAVMGAPDLQTAIADSKSLLNSVDRGFVTVTVAKKNQNLGLFVSSWGDVVNVVSRQDVSVLTWQTRQVYSQMAFDKDDTSAKAGQQVGKITAVAWDKKVSGGLVTSGEVKGPTWQWRLYGRHF